MKFELINDLKESKLIKNDSYLSRYTFRDILDFTFLYFLTLQILRQEPEHKEFVKKYTHDAVKYDPKYNYFKPHGNDLYQFLHLLFGSEKGESLSKLKNNMSDKRLIKNATPNFKEFAWILDVFRFDRKGNEAVENRFYLSLESDLLITESNYRSLRRLIRDWDKLDYDDKSLIITRLLQAFRIRMHQSEIRDQLEKLAYKFKFEITDVKNPELTESVEYIEVKNLEEAWDFIEKNCQEALTIFRRNKGYFVRNAYSNTNIFISEPRTNRRPLDTSLTYDKLINDYLFNAGFEALRNNSLFVTPRYTNPDKYIFLRNFAIFPVDGFKYTWAKNSHDLTSWIENNKDFKIDPKSNMNKIEFTNEDVDLAFRKLHELWFKGKYIAIRINDDNTYNWLNDKLFGNPIKESRQEVIPNIEEAWKLIEQNCQQALRLYESGTILKRNIKSEKPQCFIGSPRSDRKPRDMDPETDKLVNEYFKDRGFAALRSNSTFVYPIPINSGYTIPNDYYIFPMDGFKYVWSPKTDDLYQTLEDSKYASTSLDNDEFEFDSQTKLNHWGMSDLYQELDKLDYIDTNIEAAMKIMNEVWFTGKYIAIRHDGLSIKFIKDKLGLKDSIRESRTQEIDTIESAWNIIEQHCQDALNIFRKGKGFLRRYTLSSNKNAFIGVNRIDRKPLTTDKETDRAINKYFVDKGLLPRNSGTFSWAVMQKNLTSMGKNYYMIFPMDGFKYTWSPNVQDLWNELQGTHGNGIISNEKSLEEYFDRLKYTDKDLHKAFNPLQPEVWFEGQYVAIEMSFNNVSYIRNKLFKKKNPLKEAKTIKTFGGYKIWKNPTPSEIITLLENAPFGDLRGLEDFKDNIYIWNSVNATHHQASIELNIDWEMVQGSFIIDKPRNYHQWSGKDYGIFFFAYASGGKLKTLKDIVRLKGLLKYASK